MDDFIVKKELYAIEDLVTETLERTQALLKNDKGGSNEREAILSAAEKIKQKKEEELRKAGPGANRPAKKAADSSRPSSRFVTDGSDEEAEVSKKGKAGKRKTVSIQEEVEEDDEVEDVDEDDVVPTSSRGRGKATASAGKKPAAARKPAAKAAAAVPKSRAKKPAVQEVPSWAKPSAEKDASSSSKRGVRAAATKVQRLRFIAFFGILNKVQLER